MNVRLHDGSVRCTAHYDASSYQSMTDDPCLYCQADTEEATETTSDQEWLDALSALVVDQPRRSIRLGKTRPCDRCDIVATWKIDHCTGVDYLCTGHGQEWHPDLFPLVNTV